MQILITSSFLGKNKELKSTDSLRITQLDFPENLTSDWHYNENTYSAFIKKGGSIIRRKKENIQCHPGQL